MRRVYRNREQEKSNNPFHPNQSNRFGLQPKLQVGKPGDKYEQEADKVADKIVNNHSSNQPFFAPASKQAVQKNGKDTIREKPLAESITPFVQRAEKEELAQKQADEREEEKVQMQEEEEEMIQTQPIEQEEEEIQPKRIQKQEEEEEVQTKKIRKQEEEEVQASAGDNQVAGAAVENGLNATKGTGSKMDGKILQEMESGFGADFSNVNIHTDNRSAEMNKNLGAQAFTHGNDIYFNEGKYAPDSKKGKHLLAHELTHTMQQSASGVSSDNQTIRREISTPVKNYVKNPDTSKAVTFKEGDVTIVVTPDTTTDDEKMKNRAETTFSISNNNSPGASTEAGKISKIDAVPKPTITIRTVYGKGVSASSTSAYGKGTTDADKKAGDTSLGFHEGSHGVDFISYIKSHPVPTFAGKVGTTLKEFKKAQKKYKKAWDDYAKAMDSHSENLTDCVGTKASFCPTP